MKFGDFFKPKIGFSILVLVFIFSGLNVCFSQSTPGNIESRAEKYVVDNAGLVKNPIKAQILEICQEIENKMRIRVLIKTERVENLSKGQTGVESFFSDWIRSIGLEKRGILIYALLPEGSAHGKVHLRVGIGLKYLITREMGENILNQVILPHNSNDSDGQGFLEGVSTIKRMLLDELKRESHRKSSYSNRFDLRSFLWTSKEILLALLVGVFLFYIIFFVERCPRCNGALKTSFEVLKEPGVNTLGLRRKVYACERCGFSRRKKEPIYPSGKAGIWMRISGTRRNVKIE